MNVLLRQMFSHADPSQVAGLARFFKTGPGQYGEGDKFLGIKVPVTRAVVKECWRQVGLRELEECIASEYHEVRLAALLALVEIFRHTDKRSAPAPALATAVASTLAAHSTPAATPTAGAIALTPTPGAPSLAPPATSTAPAAISRQACIDFYLSHTEHINNWDLVDLSCYPLLGEWLLDKDRSLLYKLAREGRTIWEQRIGIVSTMTFIRHGQLADTFAIADILLHHPHDLIHKAVGWLLREAGKRDKAALETYLKGSVPTPAVPGSPTPPAGTSVPAIRAAAGTPGSAPPAIHPAAGSPGSAPSPALASAGCSTIPTATTSPRYASMPRTMLRYAIEKFPEAERQEYLTAPSSYKLWFRTEETQVSGRAGLLRPWTDGK